MAKAPIEILLDLVKWKECKLEHDPSSSDLPYATHEGVLKVFGANLRCYQLSNGQRVFNADDVEEFFK